MKSIIQKTSDDYIGVPDRALFTALSPYFDVNSINDYNRYGHFEPCVCHLIQGHRQAPDDHRIFLFRVSLSRAVHRPSVVAGVFASQSWDRLPHVRAAGGARPVHGRDALVHVERLCAGGYPQGADLHPPDANVGLVTAGEAAVYEELGRWITRTNTRGGGNAHQD